MFDQDEIRRRVVAGRILRDLTQAELGELLAADGLGKYDVGRLERGQMQFRIVHRDPSVATFDCPPNGSPPTR